VRDERGDGDARERRDRLEDETPPRGWRHGAFDLNAVRLLVAEKM
jgi:hypothetical protein